MDLFRTYGFEGVSLKRLAEATGFEKASLYYRYPGDKDEIAMAIAKDVSAGFRPTSSIHLSVAAQVSARSSDCSLTWW
ncbi:TetR/AcrR family transcriptional regulator [Terriglobus saanensis]|uniref:TetR/AcrR family transcriptional regulator n=1 Tax=Terriglobus saanensis TaxID=870903 RepID=UPI001FE1A0E9|nr:TetR/AcrR family transcriptional regulator [Terriglobus saanensis]